MFVLGWKHSTVVFLPQFLAPRKHDNLAQQAGPADAGGVHDLWD